MEIYDSRTVADFQKFTFSGHLRSHVYKVLDENIKLGHADYTCYWILELTCSGLVHSLWNTLFLSTAVHINRAAPNALLYLVKMYEKFGGYESQYSIMNMTDIRNNQDVRSLLCEIGASLALCRKAKLPSLPTIKPEHDFLSVTINENLKAPSSNYAKSLMKPEDPMELYVSINELIYCLRPECRDAMKALYWISWILKFSSKYKEEHKTPLVCAYRHNEYVEDKHCRHVIWLLWEVVWDIVRSSPQYGTLNPYIDALYKMYCLRWSPSDLKKRIPFLINAIYFVCESTTLDIHYSVPHDITTVQGVITNIPSWIHAIIETQKTFNS